MFKITIDLCKYSLYLLRTQKITLKHNFKLWVVLIWTQYGQSQSEKKVNASQLLLPQHQNTYPRGPESASIEIPPFQTQICWGNLPLNANIVKQDLLNKKQFLKILQSEVWKRGFQLMQILDLLGTHWPIFGWDV